MKRNKVGRPRAAKSMGEAQHNILNVSDPTVYKISDAGCFQREAVYW